MIKELLLALGLMSPPSPPSHHIEPGWYQRADSEAVGNGITSHNMRIGETGVRCLCRSDEFEGHDDGEDVFVITKAPQGYSDTIGRRFHAKRVPCFNCAD